MDFKYKIADVAKEFGVPAKKVIETVSPITGETYKTGGTFGEKELDFLLETLTRENAEQNFDAYLASGKKEEPKPAPRYPAGTGCGYRHQKAGGRHRAGAGQPCPGFCGYPHGGCQRG